MSARCEPDLDVPVRQWHRVTGKHRDRRALANTHERCRRIEIEEAVIFHNAAIPGIDAADLDGFTGTIERSVVVVAASGETERGNEYQRPGYRGTGFGCNRLGPRTS